MKIWKCFDARKGDLAKGGGGVLAEWSEITFLQSAGESLIILMEGMWNYMTWQ